MKFMKSMMSKINKNSFLVFFAATSILTACNSYALQEKSIDDNDAVKAFVSIKGITRIAVENDRISNVRGPDGAYSIQKDNQQGAIFIQPTSDYQNKPFTLFLATEQNHNYVVHCIPKDQNADTILLKSMSANNSEAQHWETSSPYTEAVTSLMDGMVNGNPPDGYGVTNVKNSSKQYLGSIVSLKLSQVFSGAYLEGKIYELTNRTSQNINLEESEFYQPGDRAISLSDQIVSPNGKAWLYKVVSHG